jgi:hypothetical protein
MLSNQAMQPTAPRNPSCEMITTKTTYVYEIRPRSDKRGFDLIFDTLPFGRLWYGEPNAISYAKFFSRSHDAVIRVYDKAGSADRPSDFRIGHQIRINFLAQFRRKLFRIVQATMTKFFRKNYSSGDNWTPQGTTPSTHRTSVSPF